MRSVFFLSLTGVLATSLLSAGDWPQWRGPLGTGHVPEKENIIETLPDDPKVVWSIPVGDGFSSPVVAGGRVFHLDNQDAMEVVHAVDAETGKTLWSETVFSSHQDGFGIGPRATPVVDGERVYAQSAKGELQCRSVADGKLLWRTNYVDDLGAIYIGEKGEAVGASRHGATGSPVIHGDLLIAQVGSAKGTSIVAFDKTTGAVKWKSQNDQTAYAAPTLATLAGQKQFLSFTVDGLIGLNPDDGALLWRVPLSTRFGRHVTTPLVVGDIAIVASHQIGLVATKIEKSGTGFEAKEAWVDKNIQTNFSSPVAVGNHLYGVGSDRDIICVDTRDGTVAWQQKGVILSSADRAEAAFMVMGPNILTLTDSGELVLFKADPAAYEEVARVQACAKTWCNPAYAKGRIYVRDSKELRCLELR